MPPNFHPAPVRASSVSEAPPDFGPPGWRFSGVRLMADGCAMNHSSAISAAYCRSRCEDELRCSLYANPPFSAGRRQGVRNQWAFRHSPRNLPLKDSMKALSVGLPGREKSSTTPFW